MTTEQVVSLPRTMGCGVCHAIMAGADAWGFSYSGANDTDMLLKDARIGHRHCVYGAALEYRNHGYTTVVGQIGTTRDTTAEMTNYKFFDAISFTEREYLAA